MEQQKTHTRTVAPHPLIDWLRERGKYRSDNQLARDLGFAAPVLSKIRRGRVAVNAHHILRVHERLGIPVPEIRRVLDQADSEGGHTD